MAVHFTNHECSNRLLLFGHLDLTFDEAAFEQVRTSLQAAQGRQRWILDTIAELPQIYAALKSKGTDIYSPSRHSLLEDLKGWVNGSKFSLSPFILPNTILSPLVVITQLLQYSACLDLVCPQDGPDKHLISSTSHNTQTIGFCTGLLSAFAISASTGEETLRKNGATAIRLAMLIGAAVDAKEDIEPSQSFSAVWHSEEQKKSLTTNLDNIGPEVSMAGSSRVWDT